MNKLMRKIVTIAMLSSVVAASQLNNVFAENAVKQDKESLVVECQDKENAYDFIQILEQQVKIVTTKAIEQEIELTINKKKLTLTSGKMKKLTVEGNVEEIKWTSSNKTIATVNKEGKITAKQAGTANITASANGKKITCAVRVLYKEGQRVADFKSKAYSNRSINNFEYGQCVWYAYGRVYDKLDVELAFSQRWNRNAGKWLKIVATGKITKDKKAIRPNAIAVSNGSYYGHVIFVEDVYDGIVYYSEGNTNGGGRVSKIKDGVIKQLPIDEFITRKHIQGYIYLQ